MTVPVWFLVERHHGRRLFAMCYERLPTKYQGKRAADNGLITAIRIDDKPHLATRSLADLCEVWDLLGTLDQLHDPQTETEWLAIGILSPDAWQ